MESLAALDAETAQDISEEPLINTNYTILYKTVHVPIYTYIYTYIYIYIYIYYILTNKYVYYTYIHKAQAGRVR